jgi:hypothetical protein
MHNLVNETVIKTGQALGHNTKLTTSEKGFICDKTEKKEP